MLRLIYDAAYDDAETVRKLLDRAAADRKLNPMLLSHVEGRPEDAAGTEWEKAIYRENVRTDYLPGLRLRDLVLPQTYDVFSPCKSVILYHDGLDLCADTVHDFCDVHTIVRFMPSGNGYDKCWKYFGKTDKKSWYKLMRFTLSVQEAVPCIRELARPVRITPDRPIQTRTPQDLTFDLPLGETGTIRVGLTDENLDDNLMDTIELDNGTHLAVTWSKYGRTGRLLYHAIHETDNGQEIFLDLTYPDKLRDEFIAALSAYTKTLDGIGLKNPTQERS